MTLIGKLAAAGLLAAAALGGMGCGTSPVAAPVADRSVNATPPPPAATQARRSQTPAPVTSAPAPAAPPVTRAAEPAKAPEPVRSAEPAPVIKPAPSGDPVVAQAIDEPPPRPYREGDWRPEFHVVKKGDTLYSIALDYGQDYRELAAWNHLEDPGVIKIDQRLRLFPPEGEAPTPIVAESLPAVAAVAVKTEPKGRKLPYSEQALAQLKIPAAKPVATVLPPASVAPPKPAPKPQAVPVAARPSAADGKLTWEWPASGKVGYAFGEGSNQKGIAIDGKAGEAVLASAPGKVVYSGSGLRGYGKLVIIKHNASYLSVYAHNSQILVKEGQSVAKGQKIAEMGATDSNRVGLHFEIRRLGKPVDPMQYLPQRAS